MKKIISIILILMLIVSMTISASAATIVPIGKIGVTYKMPSIKVPNLPASVHEQVKTTIPSNFMDNLIKAYR